MHPRLLCVGFINFYCSAPIFLRKFVTDPIQMSYDDDDDDYTG